MEIRRTANAGVLLRLDGVSILLDGVCREVKPYLATPDGERKRLSACWPDVLAFSHTHDDHFDPVFAASYQKQTNGVILCPEEIPGCAVMNRPVTVGSVRITPVESRHIGKAGTTARHVSFIIEGSQCVWFLGDASPLQWKRMEALPRPDVLMVPFAYAATASAWQSTKQLGAKKNIILHLPMRKEDPAALWTAVISAAGEDPDLLIPELGETLNLL